MGAPNVAKLLPSFHLNARIGLSATPNRQYDLDGNTSIEIFFNDRHPYVYSFSMREALDVGWLCRYTYFPHTVTLTDEELAAYIKISKQLLRFLDSKTGRYKDSREVEDLLLKRKRIIHKAVNKKEVFKKILADEFRRRGSLKFTLVYVPEGTEPDYSEKDEYVENDFDNSLIDEYTRLVSDTDSSIMVRQYTSKTPDRPNVLRQFENGMTHVLTSMKCLDEGVDVPRSELAIFCASTGNPRQFIQRRGRVLRLHSDKLHAVIHDLVVVPEVDMNEENFEMEKGLIRNELQRVVDFSELSMNKIDAYEELKWILDYYNLNLNDLVHLTQQPNGKER
jgi:superfamily II DNA or RNA helicase